jgi:hypothetical protein
VVLAKVAVPFLLFLSANTMKRVFTKVGRFFWSWGFFKFVLGVVALIILFYVEEDWRGARAWAATKAEWEAKGESFDLNKFIPPSVPDEQNLAAIPLFKLELLSKTDTYLEPVVLNRAMRNDLPSIEFPPMGDWQKGELPDMAKIQNVIATNYAVAFKGAKPSEDTLAQFNAIYPFLTDFLAASATHPLYRFNSDYTILPPAARPLGSVTALIKLSKILTLHAILTLDHHQPDLALEDIKTNYKMLSGVKRDPSLVGGLVAIGMVAINDSAIYDGLAQHSWNDAQLLELEQTLEPINFLADYQFAMRSEVAESIANIDWMKKLASRSHSLFPMLNPKIPLTTRFVPLWVDGWWDDNKSKTAAFLFQSLAAVDPQARLVFPKVDFDLKQYFEQATVRWDANAPWNLFFTFAAAPPFSQSQKFANAQSRIDEARIACALERYRLAHGVYPGSLDALAPAYIDELPHDIMNGQPYHYRLRLDGTFLLYSVGWNQVDDGGKVVYKKDAPMQIDYTQGDWVWPTPAKMEQGR